MAGEKRTHAHHPQYASRARNSLEPRARALHTTLTRVAWLGRIGPMSQLLTQLARRAAGARQDEKQGCQTRAFSCAKGVSSNLTVDIAPFLFFLGSRAASISPWIDFCVLRPAAPRCGHRRLAVSAAARHAGPRELCGRLSRSVLLRPSNATTVGDAHLGRGESTVMRFSAANLRGNGDGLSSPGWERRSGFSRASQW